METVTTKNALRTALERARSDGDSIGLVPTMGAFHDGHISLMRAARERCDFVVVSLFVNPTQFNDAADLDSYPIDHERDSALAETAGVDLLFIPSREEIYPTDFSTTVSVTGVSKTLCGHSRGPQHFQGVATVVTKLFNLVQPDLAFFGQKDAQQVAVIKRVVRDLDFEIEIVVCPTVREPDGLALSSRNTHLTPVERERATALNRALTAASEIARGGEGSAAALKQVALDELAESEIEPEYVELVSPETMQPVEAVEGSALLAIAAHVGQPRLIDNAVITTNGSQ